MRQVTSICQSVFMKRVAWLHFSTSSTIHTCGCFKAHFKRVLFHNSAHEKYPTSCLEVTLKNSVMIEWYVLVKDVRFKVPRKNSFMPRVRVNNCRVCVVPQTDPWSWIRISLRSLIASSEYIHHKPHHIVHNSISTQAANKVDMANEQKSQTRSGCSFYFWYKKQYNLSFAALVSNHWVECHENPTGFTALGPAFW